MYCDVVNTKKEIKSNFFEKWCVNQFETIVGDFPDVEVKEEIEDTEVVEKPLLKRYKTVRYFIFPVVLILIIIDESYIRIKDFVKNIDKSI
jgi:hypothetical protein